jgi:hypothetical protein
LALFFSNILPPEMGLDTGFGDQIINLFFRLYYINDPVIHVCFIIIVACFTSAFIISVSLFTHRIWTQSQINRKQQLEEQYSLLLTGIVFDEQDELFELERQKLIKEFKKKYFQSTFKQRILRKQLLFLHKSFNGPSQELLRNFYYELNLHTSALAQLRKTDWSEKADAVMELSQMGYEKAKGKVLKLTLHENKILRLQAQAAMLSLNEEDPFGFLAYATGELTEWQQLNLEEKAKRMDLKKIPNFSQWFGLKNKSVVEFCVKMTVAYNQFESTEELMKLLLFSADERVVKETVKAVGTMLVEEAQDELIKMYADMPAEVKDAVIVSLGKIGGEKGVAFLQELLMTAEHDFALKAGKSLMTLGYEGDVIIQEALQSEKQQVVAIAKHVLDSRI